jgi:hypothetical protein
MDGKSDGQTKEPKGNFSNNLNENLNESSKAFEKGFGDINANVMDMYNKQMHLLTGFYNNYFSPIMGHTKDWNIGQGFGNNFFGGNLTKMFSNPFMSMNTGFSNPFLLSFDKMYKQMMGGNNNLFSDFTGQMQGSKMDINETGRKYLEAIENQIETSKHIFNSLNEIYGNNINSSVETNKKLTEEIGKQFSLIIKQNQKIWADILDAYRMPVNGESKNSKEPTSAESKKKADAPIAA